MLESTLRRATDAVPGARGIFLMGTDGVPVAGAGGGGDLEMDVVTASYADLLRRIGEANREIRLDAPTELVVGCPGVKLVYRSVTPEYGLLAVLEPDGSVGRARYELLKASLALRPEL